MTNFQIWYYIAIFYFQSVIIITTCVNPDDVPHSVIPSLQHVETHDFGRPHPSQFLGGNDEHVTPPNFSASLLDLHQFHQNEPLALPHHNSFDRYSYYNTQHDQQDVNTLASDHMVPSFRNHLPIDPVDAPTELFPSLMSLLHSNQDFMHKIRTTLEQNHNDASNSLAQHSSHREASGYPGEHYLALIHDKSPAPSSYDIDHPPYQNMDNFSQYNPPPSSHNHPLMNSDGTAPQLFQSSSPLLNSNHYLTHGIQTLEQNHLGNSDIESFNDPLSDSRVNPIIPVISLRRKLTGHGAINGGISKPKKTRKRLKRVSSTVTPPFSSHVSEQLVKQAKDTLMSLIKYDFVDFEPKTADGQMVMYAMNSFKLRDGRSFFTLLRDDEEIPSDDTINQKLFCLGSTAYMNALVRFFDAMSSKYGYFEKQSENRFTIFWSQIRSLSSDFFLDVNNQVWLFRKSILDRFDVQLNERLPAEYKPRTYDVMDLLLAYSMYVNLISAIAPAEDLDKDGRLLENQLQKAFESFIELLIICVGGRPASEDTEIWPDILKTSDSIQTPTKTALVWKFLQHWATKEKVGLAMTFSHLKSFFNSIVFNWVKKNWDEQESK